MRGLNTAATLWGSAAIGACAGADLLLEAVLATSARLAANTLLRPIVQAINREPLDTASVEVTNTVYVIAHRERRNEVLALLEGAAAQQPSNTRPERACLRRRGSGN